MVFKLLKDLVRDCYGRKGQDGKFFVGPTKCEKCKHWVPLRRDDGTDSCEEYCRERSCAEDGIDYGFFMDRTLICLLFEPL